MRLLELLDCNVNLKTKSKEVFFFSFKAKSTTWDLGGEGWHP